MGGRGAVVLVVLALLLLPGFRPLVAVGAGRAYDWMATVEMKVPAVARTEAGYTGVMSDLTVTVAWPGTGTVYVAADPLTELDMQAAARVAALIATLLAGYDFESFDYFVRIKADSPIVGGPSASAAMAVSFLAALRGKTIPGNYSMTGMIDPDTTVGPVGGVPEKLTAAARAGVKLFAIPAGQSKARSLSLGSTVDVIEMGKQLGVKVVEVDTVLDAYALATGDRSLLTKYTVNRSIEYPGWLRRQLQASIEEFRSAASGNVSCAVKALKGLPSSVAQSIRPLIADANRSLSEGEKLVSKGLYYAAASRFFGAAISATEACLLAGHIADNDLQGLLEAVKSYAATANRSLGYAEAMVRGSLLQGNLTDTKIQLAVAVLSRTGDARRSALHAVAQAKAIEAGQVPPSLDVLANMVGDAVYAYYRARTSVQWLNTYREAPQGTLIPLERLKRSIDSYVYFAYSAASYARALGVADTAADEKVETAKAMLAEANSTTDYILALVYAVQGYTMYTRDMWEVFNTGEAAVRAAGKGLTILTNMAVDRGMHPILPLLYKEYATVLNETGARLSLYVQASSYALLLNMLAKTKSNPPGGAQQRTVTITRTATATVTATKKVTVTYTVKVNESKTITTTAVVPVNVTVTAKVPVTVTRTLATTKTVTTTVTEAAGPGAGVLALVAIVALAAGIAAGRMERREA